MLASSSSFLRPFKFLRYQWITLFPSSSHKAPFRIPLFLLLMISFLAHLSRPYYPNNFHNISASPNFIVDTIHPGDDPYIIHPRLFLYIMTNSDYFSPQPLRKFVVFGHLSCFLATAPPKSRSWRMLKTSVGVGGNVFLPLFLSNKPWKTH